MQKGILVTPSDVQELLDESVEDVERQEILRLGLCFAARSKILAQDDKVWWWRES